MSTLYKSFTIELGYIYNDSLRDLIAGFVYSLPDWLCERGATSSNKYHSLHDRGPDGLIYHTRAVVRVLRAILEEFPQYDIEGSADLLYTSILPHLTRRGSRG
jgi:hypothetical protein